MRRKPQAATLDKPLQLVRVPVDQVDGWDRNPRGIKQSDYERLKHQIVELGIYKPLLAYRHGRRYVVLGGNMRLRAYRELGVTHVDLSVVEAPDQARRIKYNVSDNDAAGYYDDQQLAELVMPELKAEALDMYKVQLGDGVNLRALLDAFGPGDDAAEAHLKLAERFLVPPFSVLDARQGYWQERKEAWLALGMQSELGRLGNDMQAAAAVEAEAPPAVEA